MSVAVYVFTGIAATFFVARIVESQTVIIRDLPSTVQPFVYALCGVWIWSFFKVVDGLYSHAWHLQASLTERLFWIAALTILMPLGPIIYYLAVYRKGAPASPTT